MLFSRALAHHRASRGRVGARARRRRTGTVAVASIATLACVAVGTSGAYFTTASSTASQGGGAASLAAPASVTASASNGGQTTNVTWTAPATRPWEASSTAVPTYTVKRNTVNDFSANSGATEVYTGTNLLAADSIGSAPVSVAASAVYGFQRMDASVALISGKPYRWGLSFMADDRSAVWQGSTGQPAFNTGVLTEMTFEAGPGEELISVAPGRDHACALSVTRQIYCIGFGQVGQTGDVNSGTATTSTSIVFWRKIADPRGVFAGKSIAQLVSGEYFSCALTTDGTIGCWGYNNVSQLGNPGATAASYGAPVRVSQANGTDWPAFATNKPIAIAAGATHVCALKGKALGSDGNPVAPAAPVACWGGSAANALGTYSGANTAQPQDIADPNRVLSTATTITAGTNATCALTAATTANVACWGSGILLGRAAGTDASPPANSGVPAAITTSVGGFSSLDLSNGHACAGSGTQVLCWGKNSFTKLGVTGASDDIFLPRAVVDTDGAFLGEAIVTVATSWSHSCASTRSGSVACWGYGAQFQLGQGTAATDGAGNASTAKPVTILFNNTKLRPASNRTLSCLDGATLNGTTCSLAPNRSYFYQVTYTIPGATNWVSAPRVVARS